MTHQKNKNLIKQIRDIKGIKGYRDYKTVKYPREMNDK